MGHPDTESGVRYEMRTGEGHLSRVNADGEASPRPAGAILYTTC